MKKYYLIFTLLFISSCSGKTPNLTKNAPDYSNSTGEFMTFAYASPTNGTYYIDGSPVSTGENYQTVERYI